ncbi:hypothetical protein [Neorhodopirellula lusitana]|nr:hypothetical protein [Neorhodopirellula lusitana]
MLRGFDRGPLSEGKTKTVSLELLPQRDLRTLNGEN